VRYFKLKDIFTTLNLFLSFYSILLVFSGKFLLASYLVFINVMILDLLDGYVARLTNSFNEFGKRFDTIVDFIGSSMTVPFFIYVAYKKYNLYLAVALAFLPLFVGVLRDIMADLEKVKATTFFIGLPRNTGALAIIAYLNSTFMTRWHLYEIGIAVIIILCGLQISHVPIIGNDKKELRLPKRVKGYLIFAIGATIAASFCGAFWDAVILFLIAYITTPWLFADKSVWQSIRNQLEKVQA